MTDPRQIDPDAALREAMLRAVMAQRGCDRAEGKVILARIADRLGGYTHAEVAERHPLPDPPASDDQHGHQQGGRDA